MAEPIKVVVMHPVAGRDAHSPRVSAKGTWLEWNDATQEYEDMGNPSRGAEGPRGPKGDSWQNLHSTEELGGLHINVGHEMLIDEAENESAAFHAAMAAWCADKSAWIEQVQMGVDAAGNALYYYKTKPEKLMYGAKRNASAPVWPATTGRQQKVRVILTSNLHGREKNGNWAVRNMLREAWEKHDEDDFHSFVYKNVEIIWIPCCCPTGDYNNALGQNVNQAFPDTEAGECVSGGTVCKEATLIKAVLDEYAADADMHIDLHTYQSNSNLASWVYTNEDALGQCAARVCLDVTRIYQRLDSNSTFAKSAGGFMDMDKTCTNYTNKVYGTKSGVIEAKDGLTELMVGYLHDLVLNTITGMTKGG